MKKASQYQYHSYPQENLTMALTKIQIVESVRNQTGFTKNRPSGLIETLLEFIKNTPASGADALVSDFVKFYVKQKDKPWGLESVLQRCHILALSRVVTFKCSGKLRDRIDGH